MISCLEKDAIDSELASLVLIRSGLLTRKDMSS